VRSGLHNFSFIRVFMIQKSEMSMASSSYKLIRFLSGGIRSHVLPRYHFKSGTARLHTKLNFRLSNRPRVAAAFPYLPTRAYHLGDGDQHFAKFSQITFIFFLQGIAKTKAKDRNQSEIDFLYRSRI
jgi:hypothetical protein